MKKTGEETKTTLKDMEIIQRNDFQNFTLDSVLLADFVKINRKTKKILDIGTGCGIISLLLAKKSKAKIVGIEIQEIMSEIAKKNIENNGVKNQVEILSDDIKNFKKLFKRDEFDAIVTNPPYFEFTGDLSQINDLGQLSRARHNIDLTLEDIIEAASYLLKNMGSFSLVFRSDRLVEVILLLKKYNLEPKRMKNCYTKYGNDAKICLLEAVKDAKKGFKIEGAIYIYDENNEKTDYVKSLYGQ